MADNSDKPIPNDAVARWHHHLLQGVAAALTLLVVLVLLDHHRHSVVMASLSASAFIVFAMPHTEGARPRNVILGHAVGVLVGLVCYWLPSIPVPFDVTKHALAVIFSFFILAAAKINHPPGVATAFGISMTGTSLHVISILATTVAVLVAVHWCMGHRMKRLL